MPHRSSRALLAVFALATGVSAASAPAVPAGNDDAVAAAELDRLRDWYLGCDRASRTAPLDASTARACSVAAEALLRRGFGGDFERLLAWWRTQRDPALAASTR